jgi:leucyl aminopeptidase
MLTCDALIVPVTPGEAADAPGSALLSTLDGELGGAVSDLLADAKVPGTPGKVLVVPTLGRLPARRLVITGVGDGTGPDDVRLGYAAAATAVRQAGARSVALALPDNAATDTIADAVQAVDLALYRFTTYHGTAHGTSDAVDPESIVILSPTISPEEAEAAIGRGAAIAAGTAMARDLVNEPASVLDPAEFAARARAVAEDSGLDFREIGVEELTEMGAGALLAVGKGSAIPPRLIHLTYRPEGEASSRKVGLVGKTITFDTGGYSIKTTEGMVEMKGDMAGGAAVLGTMSALRALGCRHEVHAVICAAENMISGEAFRPGDILTAMNGVTIEVLSTDAEGRLVLADGMVYTARQGVDEMIDLATLTGSAVVALGNTTAALFASDDSLATNLIVSGAAVGEDLWRMPLTPAIRENIRGDVGDIKNTGGRPGGSIAAALFLDYFREGLPWAHLDIAGTARTGKSHGYLPKGSTGFGVRTLLQYLS